MRFLIRLLWAIARLFSRRATSHGPTSHTVVREWSETSTEAGMRAEDLSRPVSKARLDKLVDAWAPRLTRLRGVQVIALHAGRGVDSDVAIRQSEELMRTVLERAGATFELRAG